jgi:hypothetical protein
VPLALTATGEAVAATVAFTAATVRMLLSTSCSELIRARSLVRTLCTSYGPPPQAGVLLMLCSLGAYIRTCTRPRYPLELVSTHTPCQKETKKKKKKESEKAPPFSRPLFFSGASACGSLCARLVYVPRRRMGRMRCRVKRILLGAAHKVWTPERRID